MELKASVALKVELPFNYKKKLQLKSWNTPFFMSNFTRIQEHIFLM